MKRRLIFLAFGAALILAPPALGQQESADPDGAPGDEPAGIAAEMMANCQDESITDARSVSNACTWIIENGGGSDADMASAHNNRANAHVAAGRPDLAIADYSRAVELNPDFALAFTNRANAYLSTQRFERAFADFEEAVRLNPFDPNTYFNRGNAYLDLGNFEEARNNFNGALRLDDDNPRYHYNRGLANLYDAAYEDAIADFTRTVELDPDIGHAYTNRGNANLSLERVEEALEDYTRAIEIDSGDAFALTNRGNLYRSLGRADEAMADYDAAVRVAPMFAYALSSRGEAHRDAGRFVDAIADFRVALRADPDNAFSHNALAWIFATGPNGLRDGGLAVEHALIAVTNAPGPDTLDTLAAALVEAGDTQEAMARYTQVLEYGEDNVRLYQKFLREEGYYAGAVDGIVGPGTIRAFEACIADGCQPMR